MSDLFGGELPDQAPPVTLYADRHALVPCRACNGTKRREAATPLDYQDAFQAGGVSAMVKLRLDDMDLTCPACGGAGQVVRFLGDFTDA